MDLEPLACEDDAQTRQNIRCSHIKSMDVYECSDQILDLDTPSWTFIRCICDKCQLFVLHVGRMPLVSI